MPPPPSSSGSRDHLAREVQSILSLRAPSSGPESSRLGSAPCAGSGNSKQCNGGGPNAAAPPLPLSLKDGPATDGDDGSAGDGGSAVVSKSWAADAARPRPAAVVAVGQALRSFLQVVRAHPYIVAVSIAVALVLAAAGVVGVVAAAATETRHRRDSAIGFANNAATAFQVQLQQTFGPLLALRVLIHFQPDYRQLAPHFNMLAQELLQDLPVPGAVASLQMTPNGIVSSFFPLAGNEAALNHNLFQDPQRRTAALETVRAGVLTMQGPVMLKQGYRAAIGRLPVFMQNVSATENFGAPAPPYDCPICYNETTRTRFWGFVSCVVKLQDVATGRDARLQQLSETGYNYRFYAPQPGLQEPEVIAASASPPEQPVSAVVHVPNAEWTLLVAPQQGWVPAWRTPMLASVIIASVLIGLLVMATLVSRTTQRWLLKEMKASNRELEHEKQRMDVLLARQYNLISCMAQQSGLSSNAHGMNSLEQRTLDQIDHMRRSIGIASSTAGGDQLQLNELLGEGTFGKVYKGIWRGSVVAIKTMVLPAAMSGAEKRERMAIMEAATSITMNHPNIVQTYTYTIKPATSSNVPRSDVTSVAPAPAAAGGGGGSESAGFDADSNRNSSVHSFEVSLVLEYCDHGCLRDAIDGGAFLLPGGLNYAAVLDTAADVAKAMLHLHCNQVIHSDLKLRNVLLKSDGSSERGVIAKVADFGLAVRMDVHDTHVSAFQGTMSYMAPECMLRGHISKAADVYSFGLILWEMFTGGQAFNGIPRALLGHQVAVCGLRPAFPDFAPSEYRALAQRCWHAVPEQRPTFAKALEELLRLRSRLCGPTPPMTRPQPYRLADSNRGTAAAAAGTCNSVAAAGSLMQLQSCSFYVEGSMPTIDPGQPGVHPGNGYWTPAGVPLAGGASAAPSQDDHLQQGCAPAAGAATATAATAADGCVLNLGGGGAGVSAGVISTPWLSTDSVLSAGAHGNMVGRLPAIPDSRECNSSSASGAVNNNNQHGAPGAGAEAAPGDEEGGRQPS